MYAYSILRSTRYYLSFLFTRVSKRLSTITNLETNQQQHSQYLRPARSPFGRVKSARALSLSLSLSRARRVPIIRTNDYACFLRLIRRLAGPRRFRRAVEPGEPSPGKSRLVRLAGNQDHRFRGPARSVGGRETRAENDQPARQTFPDEPGREGTRATAKVLVAKRLVKMNKRC